MMTLKRAGAVGVAVAGAAGAAPFVVGDLAAAAVPDCAAGWVCYDDTVTATGIAVQDDQSVAFAARQTNQADNKANSRACAYANADHTNLQVSVGAFGEKVYSRRTIRSAKWNDNNDCPPPG